MVRRRHLVSRLEAAGFDVTRAPGFSEASFIIERLIDTAARECGFDPADLRRLNLFKAADMPVTNALGETIDSGDFTACLDRVLERADMAGLAARRAQSMARGRLRGFGLACHIKATGGSPHENVEIRFEQDGTVTLITGTQTIGQGHETSFPQIVSTLLGVPDHIVHLVDGDTDRIATGGGHGSSRSTYMAGTSMWRASRETIAKARDVAAEELEAARDDVRFEDGCLVVAGTDRSIGLLDVAAIARQAGASLDTYNHWTRDHMTFPNGAHAVEIEIDPDTGKMRVDRYTLVDDYGVLVNPMLVEGQVHGGVAQGIGQAITEHVVYDDDGQLLSASFMDYAMPRADDIPMVPFTSEPVLSTANYIGMKGCGEAGTVGALAAVTNAVLDAVWDRGVVRVDMPATPLRVWNWLQAAKTAAE